MSALSRLNKARKSAADYTANHPEAKHYTDWRHWIIRKVKVQRTWRNPEDANLLYCDNLDSLGWRNCGDAHNIAPLGYTGWYTDSFQDASYIPVVLQLPARDGKEQYVPAIRHSDWDTCTVYLNEITDDKKQAANWADRNAEREAESCREEDAKDQAQQQIAEAREAIHTINKEVLPALKELKGANLTPGICAVVRTGISELLADRRSQFSTIKKLEDDFWQAVPR